MHQVCIKAAFKQAFHFCSSVSYCAECNRSHWVDTRIRPAGSKNLFGSFKSLFYPPLHYRVVTSLNELLASPFNPHVCSFAMIKSI